MRGRFKREVTYVYLWLIHVDIWQKPTQYCKASILQLKINKLRKKIYWKKRITRTSWNWRKLVPFGGLSSEHKAASWPAPSFLWILLSSCYLAVPGRIERPFQWPLMPFPGQPTGLTLFPAVSFSFLRPVSLVRCQGSKALSLLQEFLVLWPLKGSFSNYLWYRGSFFVDQFFFFKKLCFSNFWGLCWVFIAVLRLSLVVASRDYSLAVVHGLLVVASLVSVGGFQ